MNKSNYQRLRNLIAQRADGPITPFILISRACEQLAADLTEEPHDVANALYEELTERGWLVPCEDAVEETGS